MAPSLVLGALLIAMSDSYLWWMRRTSETPEEALPLVLAVGCLAALALRRAASGQSLHRIGICGPVLLLLVYAGLAFVAPPIVRAAVAATALLFVLYRSLSVQAPPLAFWGLTALAMPVVPSLQFVLGYPMRLISAGLTVGWLEAQGVPIAREGTSLVLAGARVEFDAPCSGVNLLWAFWLLVLIVGFIHRLKLGALMLAMLAATAAAILANVWRVGSLMYLEAAQGAPASDTLHEGLGLIAFALVGAALAFSLMRWAVPRSEREALP